MYMKNDLSYTHKVSIIVPIYNVENYLDGPLFRFIS